MIDEKKLIEELREKGKKYDEDCGYWERKGEEGNRLICAGKCVGIEQAIEIVENQTKVGEWIPCSERMPEDCDNRFYMCIVENHEDGLPMFCQYNDGYGFGFLCDIYNEETLGFVDTEFRNNEELGYEKVIAWQPLPEPYRETHETKKQTNADRIRNMTDEELAYFLTGLNGEFGEEYEGEMSCLDWLQSEVEE